MDVIAPQLSVCYPYGFGHTQGLRFFEGITVQEGETMLNISWVRCGCSCTTPETISASQVFISASASQVWMQLHPDQRQALESPVTVVKKVEQAAQYPVRRICFFLSLKFLSVLVIFHFKEWPQLI